MIYTGYALSSAVATAPMTEQIATALVETLRRCEAMWVDFLTDPTNENAKMWGSVANVAVLWSAETGAVDPDPALCVVQLTDALPAGTPSGVIAYHTEDACGRPLCLVSHVAAGGDWPSAMSHELHESRVDAPCTQSATAPDGSVWDLETDDPVEGSDYVESGVLVSNCAGPRYFGLAQDGPLDIAGAVTQPFQQLPTGYHALADGSQVFGARVSAAKVAHARSPWGRPGRRIRG